MLEKDEVNMMLKYKKMIHQQKSFITEQKTKKPSESKMKNKKQKKIRYRKSAFNKDMTKENEDMKNERLNKKLKGTVASN